MKSPKQYLIYFDGGEDCRGMFSMDKMERKDWNMRAKNNGHVGYLIGYRYWENKQETVIVYFKTKPDEKEILRRRSNSFIAARWYSL